MKAGHLQRAAKDSVLYLNGKGLTNLWTHVSVSWKDLVISSFFFQEFVHDTDITLITVFPWEMIYDRHQPSAT